MADVDWERPVAPPPAKALGWWTRYALAGTEGPLLALGDCVQAEIRRGAIRAHLRYGFDPGPDGTRMSLRADVRPQGLGWVLRPFVRGRLRRALVAEAERHAATMDEAWRQAPW